MTRSPGRGDVARSERVVLDTNVVISALVFVGGVTAAVRAAWRDGSITPLVSRATVDELMRVLAYPKFELTGEEREELLADYLPFCEVVTIGDPPPKVPACRDPFDVPFLEVAIAGKANALITGDRDLLGLRDGVEFRVATPAEYIAGR